MKRLGNAQTIADIEFVIDAPKFAGLRHSWSAYGVNCTRERHRFSGRAYSFTIEILDLRLVAGGRSSWHAMIINEWWHEGDTDESIRTTKWLKLLSGKASDVIAWLHRSRSGLEARPSGN